ncbi:MULTISPECIES: hypothetical protein [Nocardiopsidaceae]|uniref:Mobilization protein n=1 Tax=Streptomonospora nanhaiensis TaxID=1323731 RepID=A0ABY6YXM4_9ACTN|nr:hypothetical protein [Streptomonospora nanhaiensis]WAE76848.1 hypothetical protein OUQ99_31405 [Streptomonospora nanhaiensis]
MEETAQHRRGNRRTGIRRDNYVKLSLSDDEHALLLQAAKDQAMTLSGFAAHAALGVARQTLATSPDDRQMMVALNDAVIALEHLSADLRTLAGPDPDRVRALLERAAAAVETLEDAGEAIVEHSRQ